MNHSSAPWWRVGRMLEVVFRRRVAMVLTVTMAVLGLVVATKAPPAAAQTPAPNPTLPDVCGLKFAIVFDLSASIGDTQLREMQDAGDDVVTSLTGTPSSVGVYTFGTYSPAYNATNSGVPAANAALNASPVANADDAAVIQRHINGLTRPTTAGGYTNWQQGLLATTEARSGVKYDAVLFITDGVPTANGGPLTTPPTSVSLSPNPAATTPRAADLDAGITAANQVKAQGTRVIAIGVTGATQNTLTQISGPTQNSDWYLTSFAGLGDALRHATLETCEGSVTVVKEVQELDGTRNTADGWRFTASASGGTTVDPTAGDTVNGAVSFSVSDSTDVTVGETQQAGYRLLPQDGHNAVCTVNGEPIPSSNGPPDLFTVHVDVTDIVTCTVVNERIGAHLTLVKEVHNITGDAQPQDWILHAAGDTPISGTSGSDAVTGAPVLPGTYILSESGGPSGPPHTPAYTAGDWACTGTGVTQAAGSDRVTLADDADATCTIVNSEVGTVRLEQNKTVDLATAETGDTLTYTMTVKNLGNIDSGAFTATDTLPSGVTFVGATPSIGTYDPVSGVWTIPDPGVAPAATITLTITVTVTAAPGVGDHTVLTNRFEVHSPPGSEPPEVQNPCPDDAAESCADTDVPGPEPFPQLTISKTVDQSTAAAGDTLTYTVEVLNSGNTDQADFSVSDTLPADVTFVSATPTVGTAAHDPATGTVTWAIPSLAAGDSTTLAITVTVDPSAETTTQLNRATLTPPPGTPVVVDPDTECAPPAAATACAETVVPGVPRLVQDKTVDAATAHVGDQLTYTLTVRNTGTADADDVEATDIVPPHVSFVSATPSQGTYDSATGTWTIGTLSPGDTVTLTVMVTVQPDAEATTIVNRFQVQPPPGGGVEIIVEHPCTDDAAESCADTVVPGVPRLTQSKVVDAEEAAVGHRLTYDMAVSNTGTADAHGVVAHDTLPAGVTFVSATPGQGSYDSTTGTWTIGTVAIGQTVTLRVTVTVDPGTEGTALVNRFMVVPPPGAPPPEVDQPCVDQEDHSCAITDVPGVPQLTQSKTVDRHTASVGDTLGYRIVVTNHGTGDAENVHVHDLLPAGVSLVSADTNGQGRFDASTETWTLTVPAGATARLTLVVTVQPSAAGTTLTNELVVKAPPGSKPNVVEDPCPHHPARSCASTVIAASTTTTTTTPAPPATTSPTVPPVQVTG